MEKVLIGIAVVILATAGCDRARDKAQTAREPGAANAPEKGLRALVKIVTPEVVVTADGIFREYETNETAAAAKYKGKAVTVTGVVGVLGKDPHGNRFVTFKCAKSLFCTAVYFAKSSLPRAGKLRPGDKIAAKCANVVKMIGPLGRGCVLK